VKRLFFKISSKFLPAFTILKHLLCSGSAGGENRRVNGEARASSVSKISGNQSWVAIEPWYIEQDEVVTGYQESLLGEEM